jgi:hypothetical protein
MVLQAHHESSPQVGGWADDFVSSVCYRIIPKSGCSAERGFCVFLRGFERFKIKRFKDSKIQDSKIQNSKFKI